jgi:hypothetical protein
MSDISKSQAKRGPIAMIGIGIVMVLVALAGAPVPGREWIPPVLLIVGLVLAVSGVFLRRSRS